MKNTQSIYAIEKKIKINIQKYTIKREPRLANSNTGTAIAEHITPKSRSSVLKNSNSLAKRRAWIRRERCKQVEACKRREPMDGMLKKGEREREREKRIYLEPASAWKKYNNLYIGLLG